jgi:nicotinamide mononucleotide transporter
METIRRIIPWDLVAVLLGSTGLLFASGLGLVPIDFTEALGFVTGAACVWLVTRGSIWNWPIGLLNNVFFVVLFWRAKLYGEIGLQVVYFALGIWGWWQWLYGGERKTELKVSRSPMWEWMLVLIFIVAATLGLRIWLMAIGGAAPFWDAITTAISLGAQYLLCRKRLGNWWFWIVADVIYVPLYLSRGLPLIAALYAGFIGLCVVGLIRWRKELGDA